MSPPDPGDPGVPPGPLPGSVSACRGGWLDQGGFASGWSARRVAWEGILGTEISLATWAPPGKGGPPGARATSLPTSTEIWDGQSIGRVEKSVLEGGSESVSMLAGGCQGWLSPGGLGPWPTCIPGREGGRVTDSPLGSEVPAGPGRPTTAGTGSSPWAVSTQVTGRGVLATTCAPPLCIPRAGVRLRGWTGS